MNYINEKKLRREIKKKDRRHATPEEVIFIFEKILEGWKTIRIYNTIIQTNPKSNVQKKHVENISTGNCKIYQNELDEEKYNYYINLREKVYQYHSNKKNNQ
jgi:hypothetical protein